MALSRRFKKTWKNLKNRSSDSQPSRSTSMADSMSGEVNNQTDSPLFGVLPAEIRNEIFRLALTSYPNKDLSYRENDYFYRPCFRYPRRIDTALLLTCRSAYLETKNLPSSLSTHVEWHNSIRGPGMWTVDQNIHPSMTSAHLFMQQCALECWDLQARVCNRDFDCLRKLTITIRHSDWWWWEDSGALNLGRDWHRHFSLFKGLETFVLELETRIGKKSELDAIVVKAKEWTFELGDGKVLVLDPTKTRRSGWIGRALWLASGEHFPVDPTTAKRELIADGVDFTVDDGEPEIQGTAEECLVYYVVTLIYRAQKATSPTGENRQLSN